MNERLQQIVPVTALDGSRANPRAPTPAALGGRALAPIPGRPALLADHRLTRMSVTAPVHIQAELTIGAPDDPLEREADAVADAVMRMPEPLAGTPDLQRACADCLDEEPLQAMPLAAAAVQPARLQRMDGVIEDEEEQLQASPLGSGVVTAASGGLIASGAASIQVAAARQGGLPLSSSERAFFQPRLGYDLSAVRVHSGPAAAAAASAVGARAFTVGPDIVLGAGQAGPSTAEGRRLFAHELAHVVQQGHAPVLGHGEKD